MNRSARYRLPEGGRIDRTRELRFSFDGRSYLGHPGDTLASALLANGVTLVGRSFKYHRPRGFLSAGSEEPNGLFELRSGNRLEPNTRGTTVELWDGLEANSQQRWPSLSFDVGAINQIFSPLLNAGFYYKTFMWPASFWERVYEPLIRRAAGLGHAPTSADPDQYEKTTLFCDVLVIGGGPTGLMSAVTAAQAGARVVLCDDDFEWGGRLLSESTTVDGMPGTQWVAKVVADLEAFPNVTMLRRTTVFGVYDGGTYAAVERVGDHIAQPNARGVRQRLWRIVSQRSVLAAGSIERPLIFPNNDRPGVMLAGAVRTYLNRFAVAPGTKAVVVANNDGLFQTAADLRKAGIEVAACIDVRTESCEQNPALKGLDCVVRSKSKVIRVLGGKRVSGIEVEGPNGRIERISADLIAMSGGWSPTVHLTSYLGAKPIWNDRLNAFVAKNAPPGMTVAGTAAGRFGTADCLSDGIRVGAEAAKHCGFVHVELKVPEADNEGHLGNPGFTPSMGRKAFVDFQNDVTVEDIKLAHQEGFSAPEHLKRYTTLGMGTDQGKTSNVNALAILSRQFGTGAMSGTTTYRGPYLPVSLGALAGRHVGRHARPTRHTPAHEWAASRSAVFIEAGDWLRAQYFRQENDEDWLTAMKREVRAVRSAVGVCDVSTLGKIHIEGPDAADFLERLYTNKWKKLPIGRARYGLMLREDGFVFDDGTTSRLGEERFLMTTTTSNAAAVLEHIEYLHQCVWPHLDVRYAAVTEDWAQFSIAGPRSRQLVASVVDAPFDVSNQAFPYMSAGELTAFGGVPARLFRISFSGELAYELAVPAKYGNAAAAEIMRAGAPFGVVPYGLESLGAMRLEKGHIGPAEMHGNATMRDLGLEKMVAWDKEFIGREMSRRPALTEKQRQVLVGLRPVDTNASFRGGAHLLPVGKPSSHEHDQGYVSSAGFSPMLEGWIGLGFLQEGADRVGETVRAYDPLRGTDTPLRVCSPVFFDPEGERLRA
ncbi:sarcosine oxidase subunit alpha family protein [Mesorhizobium sp. DCY119]|uniref:sarcosine oxidase subunit alpha family protein n=1 Tax=Mesorhizobium sp. DCY119 TaxID=2108445 RepID=UPI000E721D31|nr:sarcosine oxidase subunit alpha family protein [Mesorhizobium sp. DCY119]RJG40481.1 sarcosine oxidase subunit alpha family protein [Mesorhizobium sp. DCY119]